MWIHAVLRGIFLNILVEDLKRPGAKRSIVMKNRGEETPSVPPNDQKGENIITGILAGAELADTMCCFDAESHYVLAAEVVCKKRYPGDSRTF